MGRKQSVALLRGINVGGRNKVTMADLRATFEEAGYGAVRTYIQSGNVLFESGAPARSLEADIEGMLERRFGVPLVVVVRSHARFRNVIDRAPDGFGKSPDTYHSDTLFLRAPMTAKQVMRVVELREGVDQAWPGDGVVYFSRLSASVTKSWINRLVMRPEYQRITNRSWSTTTKLLSLLDEHGGQ